MITSQVLSSVFRMRKHTWHRELKYCHGLSPDPPCTSKASPPPPTAWSISDAFRLASNPIGSLVSYNTMGKVVTTVVTDVLVFLTVWHSILPSKCFGGLPGQTMADSLLYLTCNIKNMWWRKKSCHHSLSGHSKCVPQCYDQPPPAKHEATQRPYTAHQLFRHHVEGPSHQASLQWIHLWVAAHW